MLTFTMLVGACDSLIQSRYPEQKAASVFLGNAARQALDPRNIQIRWNYWNLLYPFGIRDVRRHDIIDLDEAGVFVESANRGSGKAYINCRVREPGPYGHSTKVDVYE